MLTKHAAGINKDVSMLGFGCMRFPTLEDGTIDEAEAIRMVRHAIDSGVNYVDTAYPYHGGQSEVVVGKALQDGYRDRVLLASKLPCWQVKTHDDMMRLLDEQLAKLQTDHLDFYLLHSLNAESYAKMKELDYPAFFDQALKEGKIRYPAFSFHDGPAAYQKILHDYPWVMSQVQMNLLDGDYQATLEGIHEAARLGISVVIMEPLRGGLLANPPEEILELYRQHPVQRSAVEWAFRSLYTMPEVMTILSGMSDMHQVQDNLRIFDRANNAPLSEDEKTLLQDVKEAYLSRVKTRCTGCSYCQPCPMGVKIPNIFRGYDQVKLRGTGSFREDYQKLIDEHGDASRCVSCHKCEKACPQHLPVIRYLQEIHQEMVEA